MKVQVLSSGSKGNTTYIETPKAKIEKFCKVPQPIIFKRENDDVVSD